jgi:hypothetical protein
MLLKLNVDPDAPYFRIFAAGIVVSYMRPFTRADGLGRLSAKYAEFPKDRPDLRVLHELLKKGRIGYSRTILQKILRPSCHLRSEKPPNEIIINFYDNGVPSAYRVNTIQWKGIGFTR